MPICKEGKQCNIPMSDSTTIYIIGKKNNITIYVVEKKYEKSSRTYPN